MLAPQLRDQVNAAIAAAMPRARQTRPISEDADLRDTLGIDSVGLLGIAAELERRLGVDVAVLAEHAPDIVTVGDLYRAVEKAR